MSRNPGRRVIRRGYYKVVGALMWLSQSFWQLTGADRGAVESAGWIQVSHPSNTVLRIQATERCFTSANDGSEEIQRRLRSLLFPDLRTENRELN